MASNKVLRQVIKPFGRAYCFAEAIVQGGDADNNVTYAHFMKEDLEKAGHHV